MRDKCKRKNDFNMTRIMRKMYKCKTKVLFSHTYKSQFVVKTHFFDKINNCSRWNFVEQLG
jgi:hypothetical protein